MAASSMATETVAGWLRHARDDLAMVRNAIDGPVPLPTGAAYHCQQAVEKLVKAVLAAAAVRVPKSHDIADLIARLPDAHPLRDVLAPWAWMTPFGYSFRYPSANPMEEAYEEPTLDELRGWLGELSAAEAVVRAALLGAPEGGAGA
ncbi:HEPN domain-containing protein [Rhodocista pekingensis]|uniref:HEPN domain-containing protein n=1 Tax=Rhodocista pekingensis TaxID=201185 RepID=A0ABW2KUP6_9PROT